MKIGYDSMNLIMISYPGAYIMENIIQKRQEQLQNMLRRSGFQALAFNPGPDLKYLTGLNFHLMERPVVAFFPEDGPLVVVLPELEKAKLEDLSYPLTPFFYNEDPETWVSVFQTALHETGLVKGNLGVIPSRLRLLEYTYLKGASPNIEINSAQELMAKIRRIKSQTEIDYMLEAARIGECALAGTLAALQEDVTEKQIASHLVNRLLMEGSQPELPFSPIVSFGENAANPHASPTDRRLKMGDLILIDWGAGHQGYFSDITRVYTLGGLHPELEKIAEFVREANQAGREAVKPGALTSDVDRAAREVIEKAGYGKYFIHRTGHGLGLETHEEPYISQFDQTVLETGMTFTVEPGIYLPGRGGVRIEDDVVVTEDGFLSLSQLPRELGKLDPEV
jgi:Xaa-Pro dipeptidase